MLRRALALLTLLLLPLTAVAQDDDRGYIQGLLEDALSDAGRDVRLEGFEGALSSRATIDRLTIGDDAGIWLTLDSVALTWNRLALLDGRIEIDEISAATLRLPRLPQSQGNDLPSPEARGAFSLPDLPVALRLAALDIARAEIGAPVLGEPAVFRITGAAALEGGEGSARLQIDRLDAGGRFAVTAGFTNATRQLALDLSLEEPAGGLVSTRLGLPGAPSVSLALRGDAPVDDFTATLQLATDGQPRAAGRFTLSAPPAGAARQFAADLSGDIAPLLAPDYRDFFGPRVALSVRGRQEVDGTVSLRDLDLRARALRLSGAADIGPDGWPRRLSLDGQLDGTSRVLLPLPGQRTYVDGATLQLQFDEARSEDWQFSTTIDGFDQPDLSAERLTLTGVGRISRASDAVDGTLAIVAGGLGFASDDIAQAVGARLSGALSLDWRRGAPLQIDGLALSGEDYGLAGAITIALPDGPQLPLRVTPEVALRADSLSRFAPLAGTALRGTATLQVTGALEPLTGRADLRLDGTTRDLGTGIAQADALLRGTGTVALRVIRDETGTRLDPFDVTTQAARLQGTATLATGATVADVTAAVRDTALLLPGLSGPTDLTVSARQRGTGWQVSATGTAPGASRVSVEGTVTGDGRNSLVADGRLSAGIGALSAFSRLAGRPLSGTADLTATGQANLLTGSGALTASATAGGLTVSLPSLDPLLQGRARIDLNARRDDAGVLTIESLGFDAPQLTAALSGTLGGGTENVQISARIADLRRLVPDLRGPASLQGTAARNGGDWRIDMTGTGPGNITLATRGSLSADASRADLGMTGTAPLSLANPRLRPNVLSGNAGFDLRLNGPPGLDALTGQISTTGARMSLPQLGLSLTDIGATLRLAASRAAVTADMQLSSGGALRVTGDLGLDAPFDANLATDLRALLLREANLYETTANGRITLTGPLTGGARIGGRVSLGAVELRIPRTGPNFALLEGLSHDAPPPAVQLTLQRAGLGPRAAAAAQASPQTAFPLDVLVDAPNRIFVRGRGLDAELGGSLRVTGTTSEILPQGQFSLVRGRLDLLGQRLDLTEGAVQLQGDFDPYIRFVAETSTDDVDIEITLEGLASEPQLTIASIPELPQDEVLAQLLFGRDLTSLSALQAVQLADALRTLSGQGTGIAEGLRAGLGVDDFDIGVSEDGTVEARVGQYITENIYSDVSVNARGETEINLNLSVTDDVTVRGRLGSDGDSGIGIFFERDY